VVADIGATRYTRAKAGFGSTRKMIDMPRSTPSEPRGPGERKTRALGVIALAGGLLAAVTVMLPPRASGSDALVLTIGAVCGVAGVALLLTRRSLPEWMLCLVVAAGTALITIATHEGGSVGTGTADNEILYVWICLYSFYFLSLASAIGELVGVAAAYAWLLSDEGVSANDGTTRWLVTIGTLLVAGLLIARLRHSLDRLFVELADRARLDSLTGLLNRRALEDRANVEFARTRRHGGAVSMLVADIDGFKALNDTHGHPAGDHVLIRVAEVLDHHTREVDAVGRLGGDEFAVVLPGATVTAGAMIGERLRQAVAEAMREERLEVTISVGVADGPADGRPPIQLWRAADHAMYAAKRAGGDRVAVAAADAEPASTAPRDATVLVEP
jgi:diguanylate cyclase (GGDEF)-like protein